MFEPIGTGGLSGLIPDIVDSRDVGSKSWRDDDALDVSNNQLVVTVHDGTNCCVRIFGAQSGVKIKY